MYKKVLLNSFSNRLLLAGLQRDRDTGAFMGLLYMKGKVVMPRID
ncbi:hypothetical protein SAMN05421578_102569 [Paenibacillus macquariensis]|uniref:Uncharacterized protein n=1 Tax=Paenibacillus macquariensis TaxID=948756 RepID=A0ABY1JPY5_9BACL|nr:hypothetical protein SAMN05421578_102569 [Paenibacillus macquariensis]